MLKRFLLSFILVIGIFSVPFFAMAQDPLFSSNVVGTPCEATGNCGICNIMQVVIRVIEWMTAISGAVVLVVLLVGAVLLITSSGNSERVAQGMNFIKSGIIGLLIIMLAWPIVHIIIAVAVQPTEGQRSDFGSQLLSGWSTELAARCNIAGVSSKNTSPSTGTTNGNQPPVSVGNCCQMDIFTPARRYKSCSAVKDAAECQSIVDKKRLDIKNTGGGQGYVTPSYAEDSTCQSNVCVKAGTQPPVAGGGQSGDGLGGNDSGGDNGGLYPADAPTLPDPRLSPLGVRNDADLDVIEKEAKQFYIDQINAVLRYNNENLKKDLIKKINDWFSNTIFDSPAQQLQYIDWYKDTFGLDVGQ